MTLQEIYTKIRNHLLTQMARSLREGGSCAYRGYDGLKCAVGCLIPDERYHPGFEGKSIRAREVARATGVMHTIEYEYALGDQVDLLVALQGIHDCDPVESWEACLNAVADRRGLKVEHGQK